MARGNKRLEIIETLHAYSLDVKNREIYLVGNDDIEANTDDPTEEPGVEYRMASRFIKNIRFLSTMGEAPILVHLKSCGGHLEEGMAIYDAIRFCPCRVCILSYTHARSMSSIILQAADQRVLMPNSHFMFHHGSYEAAGTWQEVMTGIEWDKKAVEVMLAIYAARMKGSEHGKYKRWSLERIRAMLETEIQKKLDVFLDAETAVQWGLADYVFDGRWDTLHV